MAGKFWLTFGAIISMIITFVLAVCNGVDGDNVTALYLAGVTIYLFGQSLCNYFKLLDNDDRH